MVERDVCEDGLIIPSFQREGWLHHWWSAVYFCGLVYTCMGITAIMNIFMSNVWHISNKKKKIYELRSDLPEALQQSAWNETVAYLTIMAIGVSAPEIFLSIIETMGHGFEAGPIGPGAIIGSASTNILIVAFCIGTIKGGEGRVIIQYKVFLVTGLFHMFAYIWVYISLEVISPGEIEIWEALINPFSYASLILCAYAVSKNCWRTSAEVTSKLKGDETCKEFAEACLRASMTLHQHNVIYFAEELMKYPGMTWQDAAVITAAKITEVEMSPMWYRIGGARILTSGRPMQSAMKRRLKQVYKALEQHMGGESIPDECISEVVFNGSVLEFETPLMAVTEAAVDFPIYILRHGNLEQTAAVRVTSVDGKAVQGEDFAPVNEVVVFEPQQTRAEIKIKIIDENKYEPTEEFFLRLSVVPQDNDVKLGKVHIMEIKIIQSQSPGVIEFERRGAVVKENEESVDVQLVRKYGSDGIVTVQYETNNITAIAGIDYHGATGIIVFNQGVVRRSFAIQIYDTNSDNKDVKFEIVLSNPTGGAMVGVCKKMQIIITDDDDTGWDMDNIMYKTNIDVDQLRIVRSTWCRQIKEAMLPSGGQLESATNMDYFLHFIFFFWKVVFSLIPPTSLCDGWLSFVLSTIMVGLLATVAGDFASIFGCSVGLHETFTAMTIVAVGTSLPDAFACRFALLHAKYADSAIGNINATAAINVYLGFGLPWTMASIYHACYGRPFKIPSTSGVGKIVFTYIFAASLTVGLLLLRRNLSYFGKAEIGGPAFGRYLSAGFLIIVWTAFITISYLEIEGYMGAL